MSGSREGPEVLTRGAFSGDPAESLFYSFFLIEYFLKKFFLFYIAV